MNNVSFSFIFLGSQECLGQLWWGWSEPCENKVADVRHCFISIFLSSPDTPPTNQSSFLRSDTTNNMGDMMPTQEKTSLITFTSSVSQKGIKSWDHQISPTISSKRRDN